MAAEKATHQPLVGPDAADGNLWFPLCECTCPTVQLWEADMLTSASPAAARMVGFTVKCMDAKKKRVQRAFSVKQKMLIHAQNVN